ncbi:hypothetical protein QBC37DRAFT_401363 [Rhypophila decipiens]|uniref:Uncharacterized protein n=1 Tax=Rhypophila decipiens TaxID=261697 RepID=A0AAN7B935_9PEZI|nr:hypothetical protein QBC37DRAFT_401363 [Rhypophila decipiens]
MTPDSALGALNGLGTSDCLVLGGSVPDLSRVIDRAIGNWSWLWREGAEDSSALSDSQRRDRQYSSHRSLRRLRACGRTDNLFHCLAHLFGREPLWAQCDVVAEEDQATARPLGIIPNRVWVPAKEEPLEDIETLMGLIDTDWDATSEEIHRLGDCGRSDFTPWGSAGRSDRVHEARLAGFGWICGSVQLSGGTEVSKTRYKRSIVVYFTERSVLCSILGHSVSNHRLSWDCYDPASYVYCCFQRVNDERVGQSLLSPSVRPRSCQL